MNIDQLVQEKVSAAGGVAYLVGGAVRDRYIPWRNESSDRDYVVTGIPAEDIPAAFAGHEVDLVGASFGVFKVRFGDEVVDVALPRTERSTGDHHRDFEVQSDHTLSIEADLSRRDLTINAIAINLESGEVIDPHGGLLDIELREINFVGDPAERIKEDPLRMLRAVRFSSQLGFHIGPAAIIPLAEYAHLVGSVAPERIYSEMSKLLGTPFTGMSCVDALRVMRNTGLLGFVIPAYTACVGMEQDSPYHEFTVDEHMFYALAWGILGGASLATRWALLLHDIGKPLTKSMGEDGKAHYYEHESIGAELSRRILTHLKAPLQLVDDVDTLIETHMQLRPKEVLTDRSLRRWMNRLGEGLWEQAIIHRYADMMAHADSASPVPPAMWMKDLISRCTEVGLNATISDHALAVSGRDIMTLLNLKPGREVGDIKREFLGLVVDGVLPNDHAVLMDKIMEKYGPKPPPTKRKRAPRSPA